MTVRDLIIKLVQLPTETHVLDVVVKMDGGVCEPVAKIEVLWMDEHNYLHEKQPAYPPTAARIPRRVVAL